MAIRLSIDDGCSSDVRVAALADKYGMECIFYWPVEHRSLAYANGYEPLTFEQQMKIADSFTIGSHTLTHRHLTKLTLEEARAEIVESKWLLEDMLGVDINSFCFPRGYSNPEIDKIVYQHYDTSRRTKGVDDDGYKLVHVHPNSGANDNRPWRDCITDRTHLWMHSWELSKFGLWEELEGVLARYVTV